ncbi:hypothetical protein NDU88_002825 [Pleurodeles waltl]|uniref:Uncharacterized protein n=1 Tax=Pleurodeles waltl TaxID=8319 RepID=A0AAV7UAU0_PLEWA|nr:hypothetical protein NDU88_002825 [Pleurodeles waltl]
MFLDCNTCRKRSEVFKALYPKQRSPRPVGIWGPLVLTASTGSARPDTAITRRPAHTPKPRQRTAPLPGGRRPGPQGAGERRLPKTTRIPVYRQSGRFHDRHVLMKERRGWGKSVAGQESKRLREAANRLRLEGQPVGLTGQEAPTKEPFSSGVKTTSVVIEAGILSSARGQGCSTV